MPSRHPRPQRKPRPQLDPRASVSRALTPQQFNAARLAYLKTHPAPRLARVPANKLTIAKYAKRLIPIVNQAFAIIDRTVIPAIEAQNELADATYGDAALTTQQKIRQLLQGRLRAKAQERRAIRAAAQDVPHTPDEKQNLDIPADVQRAMREMDAQIAAMVARLGNPQLTIGLEVQADTATANAEMAAQLGLKVIEPGSALERASQVWTRNNASLIRSIPTEMAERVRQKVETMVPEGARWETIAKQLREEHGIGKNRANLIARDQVGKYNADLRDIRASACGIDVDCYEWSGAQDNRERASHLALQGQVFSQVHPSPIGAPGTAPNCRCVKLFCTSATEQAKARTITTADLERRMVAIGPRDDDPPDITTAQLQARSAREVQNEVKLHEEYKASRNV